MLNTAKNIIRKINDQGYDCFIVGGAVRDILMGLTPHDIDIATNMPICQIETLWPTYDQGKSKECGVVYCVVEGYTFEIAQFRTETKYTDHRHPDQIVMTDSFQIDASRRDLTINAMGIDSFENILDFFGGKKDIENKILRTVGNPDQRFSEDHLRLMRVARFASKLGFQIDKETRKSVRKHSEKIKMVKPERIHDELIKAASQSGTQFADYILILDDLRLLRFVLPEILATKWIDNPIQYHPEGRMLFTHIIECLRASRSTDPIHNLSILFHDVGKLITREIKEAGIPTYHGHDEAGIPIIEGIVSRLKFSNQDKEAFIFSARNHMKFHRISEMKPSKITKLVNDKNWEVLVSVGCADELSRGNHFGHHGKCEAIIKRAIEIKQQWESRTERTEIKVLSGGHIMEITNLKPGKIVGHIKQVVSDWIIDNNIDDQVEIDRKILSVKETKDVQRH